jgi:hypothetical protein
MASMSALGEALNRPPHMALPLPLLPTSPSLGFWPPVCPVVSRVTMEASFQHPRCGEARRRDDVRRDISQVVGGRKR